VSIKLDGKVAFITGASRGIGAAVARALSTEGVKLGLASRSGDDLGLSGALGLACDVRDRSEVEPRGDDRREPEGDDLYASRRHPAPDRQR
jgi:NAD(P)-dependent dehydrogenase (short-subunit alcohol dehydrogenase family)